MKLAGKAIYLILSISGLLVVNGFASRTGTVSIIAQISNNDTTYYHILISEERLIKEEFIKTYESNAKSFADILKIEYQEYPITGHRTMQWNLDTLIQTKLMLSAKDKDTLQNFRAMLMSNNVRHNLGVKFSGRYGSYSIINSKDTIKAESSNLFSLTQAMGVY